MIRFVITGYSGLAAAPVVVVPGGEASSAEVTKPQDPRPALRLVK